MKKRYLSSLLLLTLLASLLVTCGTTPEPTIPPPTQTPWIIVVTATPGPERATETVPTQTPWIIVATPTRVARATATPTEPAIPTEPATPGASTTAPATVAPTATRLRLTPTPTPEAALLIYPAPLPLEPPDGAPVSWKATVLIKWSSVGELAADEYYHLHLDAYREANGQHWYGDYVYTKDTHYLAEGSFLAPFHPSFEQGGALVYWWVRVVRKTGVDEHGKPVGVDISPPSEKHYFVVDPKPSES